MSKWFTLPLWFIFTFLSIVQSQPLTRSQNVKVELVTEVTAIQPGVPFSIALRMKMNKGWHTYWKNGADSGLPTEIKWQLPDGFSTGDIQWPYPERIDTPPLTSYGYHGEILLLNKINVPENLKEGQNVKISAKVSWLECEDVCIPGSADLTIDLKVTEKPVINEDWVEKFASARSLLPLEKSEWQFTAIENDSTIVIQAKAPQWFSGDVGKAGFFPYEFGVIEYASAQESFFEDGILTLILKRPVNARPVKIEGIIVTENGWRGEDSEKAHYVNVQKGGLFAEVKTSKAVVSNLLLILFLAFAGGIILNLMPCVLPVLSLKIMGFIKQANEDKSKVWQHGMVFTLGVLISFWVLAGILISLRAGGEQIGWGFQLQEPVFLIVLSVFLFLFGLNMFGVFDIGMSLTSIEGKTVHKSGWSGSLISGVTATVVATPCTAPFMGTALGFAVTQPAWVSMSVFTFLGLGMAFPYVMLTSVPALLKFVPKPGRWMESTKQFMGFLLIATVIWLLWVLGIQAGPDVLILVLSALLIISIAAWIYGRWGNLTMPKTTRAISSAFAFILTISSLYASIGSFDRFATTRGVKQTSSLHGINWQPYSEKLVNESLQDGKAVFIDFTAAWCLSCQVNEKVAFSSLEVQQKIKESGIITLKGDWTSRDEKITKALAGFGRNSVPLYVFYPGNGKPPLLLPELLTPGIVLDFFNKINVQSPITLN